MKIISWNIRGLGRIYKRKEVWKLVGEKNPPYCLSAGDEVTSV
jgi:hypothetical protein